MSVLVVTPGSATSIWQGELDERGQRRYVVSHVVVTDDAKDGVQVVGDAPGVPTLYAPYQYGNDVDLGSTLKAIRPRRMDGTQTAWQVDLEYDSTLGHPDTGQRDPTMRRRKKQWSATSYEVPLEVDLFGNPIINTANDEFDPPPMRVRRGLRLVYTKNVATESEVGFHYSFIDCVNEDTFQGFVPRTACMVDFAADEQFDNNQLYWEMTMVFEFRTMIPNPITKIHEVDANGVVNLQPGPYFPWNKTILNNGLHRLGADGKLHACFDDDKGKARQPVRLELNGSQMPSNRPRSDAIFLSWQVSEQKSFAALGVI